MKTLVLIAVVALGAVCAQAFSPASQETSAVAITAKPAVRAQLASLQEITIDTALRGLFIILK